MGTITYVLRTSLRLIFKDWQVFIWSFSPAAIGAFLYYLFGHWLYTDVLEMGKELIKRHISTPGIENVLYGGMIVVLTAFLFLLIHWTFILFISLIAAPFNNFLSSRVAAKVKGESLVEEKPQTTEVGNFSPGPQARWFKRQMQRLGRGIKYVLCTFGTELKKIVLILLLTIIAWSFSLVPFLVPLSVVITMALTAVNFLDYSWGRDDLTFKGCFKNFKKGLGVNVVSGGIFLCLLAIPILNVFVLPLAVIYFTVLYTLNYQA